MHSFTRSNVYMELIYFDRFVTLGGNMLVRLVLPETA